MQITLHTYAKVVRKRFSDTAAIVIRDIMLVELAENMMCLLMNEVDSLTPLLVENKAVATKRKDAERNIAGITSALGELDSLA